VHVLHTESVKSLGGQSLRLVTEARLLEKAGHRCTIAGAQGSEFHRSIPPDVRFVPFRFSGKRFKASPLGIGRAWRLLRELEPDVVHTHSSLDAWTFGAAARLAGIPIVRGRHVFKPIPAWGPSRLVYSRLADAFTASGATIGRELVESGVAGPEEVFNTGGSTDLDRFDPARVDRGALRGELRIPTGARVIGTACNVRRMKGVDVLVAAFDELVRGGLDVHLVHAGGGRSDWFDPHRARHPGRIHALGFRGDIERVIAGLDLFVMSSRSHEGTSQVLCQAMALGVPVVATRTGCIPDLVVPGETGILVAPDDPEQLAAGIRGALELEAAAREAMLARARDLVRSEYSIDTVTERYVRAYELVLGKARGRRRAPLEVAGRGPRR
jgi:glycosyltransferase involved in cell wall biosynthesis